LALELSALDQEGGAGEKEDGAGGAAEGWHESSSSQSILRLKGGASGRRTPY
jgi:hypothetical protein